ncbi:MAG: N-6 DNA methylase [bacterium]|nr:N-6 DNA methylase [bacterium]
MAAPQRIKELVENFKASFDHVQSPAYKEEDLRNNYLNPFFQELGWDMEDKAGKGALRDLRYEETIKSGAPDYGFYTDRKLRFYVEAKNPSVNICANQATALQLRGYGWSAKVPRCILTDFEELAIYDTTVRPKLSDRAQVAREGGTCIKYTEFVERWDEIAALFSREAVMAGSLEKLERMHTKQTVDKELLIDISRWREMLAKNIANRNKISEEKLNRIVQETIDRILFLRICEDRRIANEGDLSEVAEGDGTYTKLHNLFKKAAQRYDSDLFEVDSVANLAIDDKVLKDIISELYFPKSPYKFDAIPAEILGQVYEQFLGKVIRLTEGGHAKVEEKPEVRKAGGIYYTPMYIVEYIVKNTIGKLVEGKTPREIATLSIVDPACGSGSFLLGAYKFLADWYRDWYVADGFAKHEKGKKIYRDADKQPQLTLEERKRILTAHIYGVDLDRQAVEMAKLSLMLEALRAPEQQSLFNDRMLPRLGDNIKCGNSLIASDFSVIPEDLVRVHAFDWPVQFPAIMKAGGFDAVIGNPPWGAEQPEECSQYIERSFKVAQSSITDSYALFIERAVTLLQKGGRLSFIVPDTFLRKDGYKSLREVFLNEYTVEEMIETGPVFSQVRDTWCLIFSLRREKPSNTTEITHKKISRFVVGAEERLEKFWKSDYGQTGSVAQVYWAKRPGLIVGYLSSLVAQSLICKIESHPQLGQLAEQFKISRGEEGSKFNLKRSENSRFWMVVPENVHRYDLTEGMPVSLAGLTTGKVDGYYTHPKIWIVRIQKMRWPQRIVSVLDLRKNSGAMKTLQVVISKLDDVTSLKYLQAVLGSKLVNFWCVNYLADDVNQTYLERLPIRQIDFSKSADKSRHDELVELVDKMLALTPKLRVATSESEKATLQNAVTSTDQQIDQLVYKLYGLTDEEIKIVEQETK